MFQFQGKAEVSGALRTRSQAFGSLLVSVAADPVPVSLNANENGFVSVIRSGDGVATITLPSALLLPVGAEITVAHYWLAGSRVSAVVNTFDAVLLDEVSPTVEGAATAMRYRLLDNSTMAGVWSQCPIDIAGTPEHYWDFLDETKWGAAVGGVYSYSVPAATHGLGANVQVQTYTPNAGAFRQAAGEFEITAAGDVTLFATEVPDTRYYGLLLITR